MANPTVAMPLPWAASRTLPVSVSVTGIVIVSPGWAVRVVGIDRMSWARAAGAATARARTVTQLPPRRADHRTAMHLPPLLRPCRRPPVERHPADHPRPADHRPRQLVPGPVLGVVVGIQDGPIR